MTAQFHLAFSFCILQKFSLCWRWRLTVTTMITKTVLTQWTLSWTWHYWSQNICVAGIDNTEGTWHKRQTDRLLATMEQLPHLSLTLWLKEAGIFSSLVAYILLVTGMKLTGRTKCLTDNGRYEMCLKFKWHIFHILQQFQKSGYQRNYCFLRRRGGFQTVHTKETEAFRHQNFQTLWLEWICVQHESILGEGWTAHSTVHDSNPCDSDRTDEEHRTWAQIILGQFISFPWMMWWLGKETDLLLWDCKAEQQRHATRCGTQDNENEMGRYSCKGQGWLDSNNVAGQDRHLHVEEYSWCLTGK